LIRKLYRAPDPELDAQLDLILKHGHDDKYALLKHGHDDKYSSLSHLHDERYELKCETGSNANGTWRKWADGTLECWGTKTFTSVAVTTLWSAGIYISPLESVTWPISFAVIESANINVLAQTPTQFVPALIDFVSSYRGNFYFWRPASFTFDSITVGFYAKGRWK
jgi:hypothetical protein